MEKAQINDSRNWPNGARPRTKSASAGVGQRVASDGEMGGVGAFWGTRVMEIVKKHDSGGLVWKRVKLTTTRKANAKKRLLRVWQNEAVLKACAESPPSKVSGHRADGNVEKQCGGSQVNEQNE